MEYITKTTALGAIKGIEHEKSVEFRGVRYARAGRFERPVEEGAWEGTYDATHFGACCYQHRAFEEDAVVNPFYHKEFRAGLEFTYSEDCFFLNIEAPKDAKNCPVLFFIHGGSFTGGSADEAHINGRRFAEQGVVFVAINYRLGPYGFCAHRDFKDADGALANFGLYDQTAAIKWVRRNIADFGGDPDNITLMGQSAGAMSVDIHLNNPALKGAFKGAIMLSGTGLQRCLLKPMSIEKISAFWDNVASLAGVPDVAALKEVEPKSLYYAWKDACKQLKLSMPYTFPVYDNKILFKETFKLNYIPDIPYLIGCTCTDMFPIVLERLDKKWGNYIARHNRNRAYFYCFNRWLPGDDMGAWHSADLLYVFSTLERNWRPFEQVDYTISRQLSAAVCAFTKTGNPNCTQLPAWYPGAKRPMGFSEQSACTEWHTKDNIQFTFSGKGKTI